MKVSPGEVYDLFKEGVSKSEIARRLKISRALVDHKLREHELDNLKREAKEMKAEAEAIKAEVEAREAVVEAKEREISKIPELEERAQLLRSEVNSLTKERDELEKANRSKREVWDEIKEQEERREEDIKQLSELERRIAEKKFDLSKLIDLQGSAQFKLDEIQKQTEIEEVRCYRLKHENEQREHKHEDLKEESEGLEETIKQQNEAIKKIEESYEGFITVTKQLDLCLAVKGSQNSELYEKLRKKILQGMELIAKQAKITKPDFESDLQALLRDPSILKIFEKNKKED